MFRSKGFTAAFIFLSILILVLMAALLYLLFGKGKEALEQVAMPSGETVNTAEVQNTDQSGAQEADPSDAEETDSPEEETEKAVLEHARALQADEKHVYPIMGEELSCPGTLTIIRSGDNGEGITFHAYPQFDAAESPGNCTMFSGDFRIVSKIYVLDNNRPYLMYRTTELESGKSYYVTSNPTYVSFTPDTPSTVPADSSKVISYGYGQEKGYVATVHHDDGNTLAFSVMNYSNGQTSPILVNVIAQYDETGTANFDFKNTNGKRCTGTVTFEASEADAFTSKVLRIHFSKKVKTDTGNRSSIVLKN